MDYGGEMLLKVLSDIVKMTAAEYRNMFEIVKNKDSFNVILGIDMLNDLLNDLNVIDEFTKNNYQKLHFMKIEAVSKKGTDEGAALIDGRWIPKSQMRCDADGNLWVSLWFYDKMTRNEE